MARESFPDSGRDRNRAMLPAHKAHRSRRRSFTISLDEFVENLVCFRQRRRFFLAQDGIAAHEPKHFRRGAQARRLRFVFAAVPRGIVADRVDDHAAPGAIASGNLRRQTRQRHERVHEIGMHFAPEPGVHSAHRRAHDEARMIHAEPFGQQSILRLDHVAIAVTRKLRVHSIARLARFAVADAVRQHDEKFRGIERLTCAEKFAGKFRTDKLRAAAGRAVHDQDGVRRFALRVLLSACQSSGNGCAIPAGFRPTRT